MNSTIINLFRTTRNRALENDSETVDEWQFPNVSFYGSQAETKVNYQTAATWMDENLDFSSSNPKLAKAILTSLKNIKIHLLENKGRLEGKPQNQKTLWNHTITTRGKAGKAGKATHILKWNLPLNHEMVRKRSRFNGNVSSAIHAPFSTASPVT